MLPAEDILSGNAGRPGMHGIIKRILRSRSGQQHTGEYIWRNVYEQCAVIGQNKENWKIVAQ